ncbi:MULTISPECIES: DUF2271 domain-containing protein [Methylobacillus]|uniref:Periplasmic protein n=1 Tax=Methylobacillus flagellatus (strain ATCC 51484 / DSM 6875 / VKM B-1610 / KT) TaxID=265072 RepID=Q1H492_METFK|nr:MULTISPECIES: DUF2271 domain-containing protein [Methylobacillus]ABE48695.1 conserved hypothetical protein [Methylobacillus flagellatus KT]MPS49346.1 DUF2271 domain-containing protein [Methylobacillus sp.]
MRYAVIPALIAATFAGASHAAGLDVKVTIPRVNAAEYHRPYLAIWVETPNQDIATTLSVWYAKDKAENKGTKWLKDLRQWWRKGGRDLSMPLDGVSGATKPVGEHTLSYTEGKAPLEKLAPGEYNLVVEAVREKGDRELVRVPFKWPVQQAESLTASGQSELGAISLQLKP